MFTVLRNTSVPASRKPERESKREMTNRMEGYRLEVAKFCCLSFQGVSRFSRFGSSPTTGPLAGRISLKAQFSPIFPFQAIGILLFYRILSVPVYFIRIF